MPPTADESPRPAHAAKGDEPVLRGRLGLPPGTPLDRFQVGGRRMQALLSELGAEVAGDLLRLRVSDLNAGGCAIFGSLASLRKMMAPWMDAPAAPSDCEPLVAEDYPTWFEATPLADVGLSPALSRLLAPCLTVGGLRPHPARVVTGTYGQGEVGLERLRRRLKVSFDAMSAAREGRAGRSSGYDPSLPLTDFIAAAARDLSRREGALVLSWLRPDDADSAPGSLSQALGIPRSQVLAARSQAFGRFCETSGIVAALGECLAPLAERGPVRLDVVAAMPWASGLPERAVRSMLRRCVGLEVLGVTGHGDVVMPLSQKAWNRGYARLRDMVGEAAWDEPAAGIVERFGVEHAGDPNRHALERLATLVLGDGDAFDAMMRLGIRVADDPHDPEGTFADGIAALGRRMADVDRRLAEAGDPCEEAAIRRFRALLERRIDSLQRASRREMRAAERARARHARAERERKARDIMMRRKRVVAEARRIHEAQPGPASAERVARAESEREARDTLMRDKRAVAEARRIHAAQLAQAKAERLAARRAARKAERARQFELVDTEAEERDRRKRFAGPVKAGTLRASVIDVLRVSAEGISLPDVMERVTGRGGRPHTQKGVHLLLKQHGFLGGDGLWTLRA